MPRRVSTVRGREFGDGMRAALRGAKLTSTTAAQLLHWDKAKVSDLLNGKGGSTEVELGILLGLCRTPHQERDHLLELFREAHIRGWLQQHGTTYPIYPRTFVEHLNAAKHFITWSPLLVPGLLQIPDYMRAIILASATAPANEVEARIANRVAMQDVFRRRLECTVYLHEQALLLPVGDERIMSDQLHHLLRMSVRPYITLRVVLTSIGAHAGLAGPFSMMKFDKIEPIVMLESENSSLFVEAPTSVKGYLQVVESLDRTALDEEQSRRRITELAS